MLDDLETIITLLYESGVKVGYVDYRKAQSTFEIVSILASEIGLLHLPYNERCSRMQFLDGMIGLSHRENGVLLFVDHAYDWILTDRREAFNFIETFLTQADDWLLKNKPCHLLLQIEADDRVEQVFRICKSKFTSQI